MRLLTIISLVLLIAFGMPVSATQVADKAEPNRESQPLYTYYSKPPFVVDDNQQIGLFFDLAKYLSQQSKKLDFHVVYMPRKRLEHLLLSGELDGPILGVNPLWFGDKKERKYLWTEEITWDLDDFVSLKSNAFEYANPSSLLGKTFAGVAGLYYFRLNDLTNDGKVRRVDTIGDRQVLQLIEKGRVDFGIVSRSAFQFLLKHSEIKDIYHLSAIPHEQYARRILIPHSLTHIHTELSSIINAMKTDPNWTQLLNKYQ